jgi:hypothetical protein
MLSIAQTGIPANTADACAKMMIAHLAHFNRLGVENEKHIFYQPSPHPEAQEADETLPHTC